MGINLAHYKTIAFAVGAFYAGIPGGLFAGLAQFVNPDAFVFPVSILYVTMAILGGISTLAGAALGGMMLTVLPELLRGAAEYKDFLTGLLLLLLLMFLPNGAIGLLAQKFGRMAKRERQAPRSLSPVARGIAHDVAARGSGHRAALLQVAGLGISFGGLTRAAKRQLRSRASEILGVIGPNGAGKTTLFNLMSGMDRPDAGTHHVRRTQRHQHVGAFAHAPRNCAHLPEPRPCSVR